MVKKYLENFGPIIMKNTWYQKLYYLWVCNSSLMSQRGQLPQKSFVNDMLHQQPSTIPPVGRQDSARESRIGCSTLISRPTATRKKLWSRKFEGMSKDFCPLGECNNYSYLQILLILLQFHLALIQIQKMKAF